MSFFFCLVVSLLLRDRGDVFIERKWCQCLRGNQGSEKDPPSLKSSHKLWGNIGWAGGKWSIKGTMGRRKRRGERCRDPSILESSSKIIWSSNFIFFFSPLERYVGSGGLNEIDAD